MIEYEFDDLFSLFIELIQLNYFNGFWILVFEFVEFMKSGWVVIESMFLFVVFVLNG